MPNKKLWHILLLIGAFVSQCAYAMVFDNRYLPLLQRPRLTVDGTRSEFAPKFFVTTANSSINESQSIIPLGQIFGKFDQVQLANGIMQLGNQNPLPSEFQGVLTSIPWTVDGKRQAQGVAFAWRQSIVDWLSTGFSWLFMRVESRHTFKLDINKIEPNISLPDGDLILLDDNRRAMFNEVGILEGNTAQLGFGDIDWYLRVGNMWEYAYRFRRIDAGLRMGVLFPTGQKREENRPASIPFGGNGHWGIYAEVDTMLELREDWKVGFMFRINKRFEKTQNLRVPVAKEPSIFGSTCAPIAVNPGPTGIISPQEPFLLR